MSNGENVVELRLVRGGRQPEPQLPASDVERPVVALARMMLEMAESGEIDDMLCVGIAGGGAVHTGVALGGCPVRALGAVDVLRQDVYQHVG
jgi:hypothetical protein